MPVISSGGGGGGITIPLGWTLIGAPADSTTYYAVIGQSPITTADTYKYKIPVAGTLTYISLIAYIQNTGSSEDVLLYIRKNAASDSLISTTQWDANTVDMSGTISLSLAAGDTIELKLVTPAWAANPSTVRLWGFGYLEL